MEVLTFGVVVGGNFPLTANERLKVRAFVLSRECVDPQKVKCMNKNNLLICIFENSTFRYFGNKGILRTKFLKQSSSKSGGKLLVFGLF